MSDDLISRSSVLKIIEEIKCSNNVPKNYGTLLDILQAVRNLPTAYDVDKVVRQFEKENAEMREAIRKLLCSEYGSSCEFCIQDSNDNAKCRKVGGSGSWCCENAAYDNEWNKRQVE